ncbi:hypothetical protein GOP47_0020047 [Adiantum capillus-veneris]|uniref:Uncharacterized protein n=1 Tax=Adiantum capillus-veneris TaxID=13818 RepID=A0A9D4UCX7_ADICA|nr:hypothetical protein GOP47_0020047 [Adiantum capillus-veneris]
MGHPLCLGCPSGLRYAPPTWRAPVLWPPPDCSPFSFTALSTYCYLVAAFFSFLLASPPFSALTALQPPPPSVLKTPAPLMATGYSHAKLSTTFTPAPCSPWRPPLSTSQGLRPFSFSGRPSLAPFPSTAWRHHFDPLPSCMAQVQLLVDCSLLLYFLC